MPSFPSGCGARIAIPVFPLKPSVLRNKKAKEEIATVKPVHREEGDLLIATR
jgi:hypothetical protein